MPELSDLLKLRHLMWQATNISIYGTLNVILGSMHRAPQTLEQLIDMNMTSSQLSGIRTMYDQLRREERKLHMPEIMIRQIDSRRQSDDRCIQAL